MQGVATRGQQSPWLPEHAGGGKKSQGPQIEPLRVPQAYRKGGKGDGVSGFILATESFLGPDQMLPTPAGSRALKINYSIP